MSERTEAILHGADPGIIDANYIELNGQLYHKSCCCGCGESVGIGSAVIKGTTFIFRDADHLIRWIDENTEFVVGVDQCIDN